MKTFSLIVVSAGLAGAAAVASPAAVPVNSPGLPIVRVAQEAEITGKGTVNAVDPGAHKINLTHEPIAALGWPTMRMTFPANHTIDLKALKAGTQVDFVLEKKGSGYEVKSVTPVSK